MSLVIVRKWLQLFCASLTTKHWWTYLFALSQLQRGGGRGGGSSVKYGSKFIIPSFLHLNRGFLRCILKHIWPLQFTRAHSHDKSKILISLGNIFFKVFFGAKALIRTRKRWNVYGCTHAGKANPIKEGQSNNPLLQLVVHHFCSNHGQENVFDRSDRFGDARKFVPTRRTRRLAR